MTLQNFSQDAAEKQKDSLFFSSLPHSGKRFSYFSTVHFFIFYLLAILLHKFREQVFFYKNEKLELLNHHKDV